MSTSAWPSTSAVRTPACSRCGVRYTEQKWRALRISGRIVSADIRRFASNWPEGSCIEVRRCRRCGYAIARSQGTDASTVAVVPPAEAQAK